MEQEKQRVKSLERENFLNSLEMQELKRDKRRNHHPREIVVKTPDLTSSVINDQSKEEIQIILARELDKLKKKDQLERMMQEADLIKIQKLQKKYNLFFIFQY